MYVYTNLRSSDQELQNFLKNMIYRTLNILLMGLTGILSKHLYIHKAHSYYLILEGTYLPLVVKYGVVMSV